MTEANSRDELILDHVRRYHLTTDGILASLFFENGSVRAARKVTIRLKEEGKLNRYRFFEDRVLCQLTPRAAEALGEHRSIARKFNYQGLVNAYGVLLFCAKFGVDKFTAREFMDQFPDLHRRGTRASNYYIDNADGVKRLGFIQVDSGGDTKKLVQKIRKIIARAYGVPNFAKLIQGGRFMVAIVAPSPGKKALTLRALEDEPAGPVKYRVEAIDELGHLLINPPEKMKNAVSGKNAHRDAPDTGSASDRTPDAGRGPAAREAPRDEAEPR
jgi:hypothetical protein